MVYVALRQCSATDVPVRLGRPDAPLGISQVTVSCLFVVLFAVVFFCLKGVT